MRRRKGVNQKLWEFDQILQNNNCWILQDLYNFFQKNLLFICNYKWSHIVHPLVGNGWTILNTRSSRLLFTMEKIRLPTLERREYECQDLNHCRSKPYCSMMLWHWKCLRYQDYRQQHVKPSLACRTCGKIPRNRGKIIHEWLGTLAGNALEC